MAKHVDPEKYAGISHLIALQRLVGDWLEAYLDKGDARTSKWDTVPLRRDQKKCKFRVGISRDPARTINNPDQQMPPTMSSAQSTSIAGSTGTLKQQSGLSTSPAAYTITTQGRRAADPGPVALPSSL